MLVIKKADHQMCFAMYKEWKIVGEEMRESMRLSQSEQAPTHDKAKQLHIYIKRGV